MSSHETRGPQIDVSALPDISREEMDFLDSSFFQSGDSPRPQLPSPASILDKFGDLGADVIKVKELNMVVKYNVEPYLQLEEAQAMWAIRRAFPDGEVPVQEVFGWRRYDDRIFLYMSLVPGQTLREAWPSLTANDKSSLQAELRGIVTSLRQLTQSPEVIGSVNGGPLQDRFFTMDGKKGPLSSIKEFNDWLFAIATRQAPEPGKAIQGLDHPYMYRDRLPNTGNIYFAHGDLTVLSIMVSGAPRSYAISGIIGWGEAGWYPEWWEDCKLLLGVELDPEWCTGEWGDKTMTPFEDISFAVAEYSLWCCPW